jgi:hypothetical protein
MKRFVIISSLILVSGCSDLSAINGISTRLSNASSGWNDVGNEIASSCQRELRLNPELKNCAAEEAASKGLIASNRILKSYFSALASAANGENFAVDPGLNAAAESVGKIPGINQEQTSAVFGIVGLLARMATESMREKTIRDLIESGAPAAKTTIKGLDDLVVSRLYGRLESEADQLTGKYAIWIGATGSSVGAEPKSLCKGSDAAAFNGTGFLLVQDYCTRLGIIEGRKAALVDYQQSLRAAEKALTELQSSKTKLKASDLAKRLYSLGSELDEKITNIRKAFS